MFHISKNKLLEEHGYMTATTLPGGRTVTVSGTLPLTLSDAKAVPPMSITIYGNTIDGAGVGDRTSNLFNGEVLPGRFTGVSFGLTTSTPSHRSIRLSVPAGMYYICASTDIVLIRIVANNRYMSSELSKAITVTDDRYDIGWSFRRTDGEDWNYETDKVWVVEGTTGLPYEPYGYKLPLVIASAVTSEAVTHTEYIGQPLYYDSALTIGGADLPTLFKGDNILSVDTSVQPESITVRYIS